MPTAPQVGRGLAPTVPDPAVRPVPEQSPANPPAVLSTEFTEDREKLLGLELNRHNIMCTLVEIHRSRRAPLNDYNVDLQKMQFFRISAL